MIVCQADRCFLSSPSCLPLGNFFSDHRVSSSGNAGRGFHGQLNTAYCSRDVFLCLNLLVTNRYGNNESSFNSVTGRQGGINLSIHEICNECF